MAPNVEAVEKFLDMEKAHLESVKTSSDGILFKSPDDQLKIDRPENKLNILVKKLEENIDLYSQLEAIKRNRDTKIVETEIKLLFNIINENMEFYPFELDNIEDIKQEETAKIGAIELLDSDSLLKWWLIYHQIMIDNMTIYLVCSPNTVAVCYLLVQHMNQSGLDVTLKCRPASDSNGVKAECLGVITEKSDVDSAVDVFLASPTQCHWGLRRIFVQESAYPRFKKALSWKCGLKQTVADIRAAPLCSEAHCYDSKLFLLDYAASKDQVKETKHVIFVEAFRTVKELLSLIEKDPPSYLSLWSSDISEANEIAYSANAPIVWINDYASFNAPFSLIRAFDYDYYKGTKFVDKTIHDKFFKSLESWTKLSVESRIEKVLKCVKELDSNLNQNLSVLLEKLLKNNLKQLKSVELEKGKIWVRLESCKGIIGIRNLFYPGLVSVLESVVFGNGVIYMKGQMGGFQPAFFKCFEKYEVPVMSVRVDSDTYTICPGKNSVKLSTGGLYNVKTVCTNFGTIFAN